MGLRLEVDLNHCFFLRVTSRSHRDDANIIIFKKLGQTIIFMITVYWTVYTT